MEKAKLKAKLNYEVNTLVGVCQRTPRKYHKDNE